MATRAAPGTGETYYREANDVIREQGVSKAQAFEIVAERHGTNRLNVQSAYYRAARQHPDSGVAFRPRSNGARRARPARPATPRPAAPRPQTSDDRGAALRALAADLERSAALLRHEADAVDAERATLAGIRDVLNGRPAA